jgi:hypothetical protein
VASVSLWAIDSGDIAGPVGRMRVTSAWRVAGGCGRVGRRGVRGEVALSGRGHGQAYPAEGGRGWRSEVGCRSGKAAMRGDGKGLRQGGACPKPSAMTRTCSGALRAAPREYRRESARTELPKCRHVAAVSGGPEGLIHEFVRRFAQFACWAQGSGLCGASPSPGGGDS